MADEGIEIGSFKTGLALGDNYFTGDQPKDDWYLLPALNSLIKECEGLIKEPGLYSFKLQVNKLK